MVKIILIDNIFEKLAKYYPDLTYYLKAARIQKEPGNFLRQAVMSALLLGVIVYVLIGIIEYLLFDSLLFSSLFIIPLTMFFIFYTVNIPRFNLIKAKDYIDAEVLSAVRFLSLELKSQRSLFGAVQNTADNFPAIGIYFQEVINDVKVGKTMEESLNEAIDYCPSPHLRNLFWQLTNSLQTGADITDSLENLMHDVEEEQNVRVEEYGKELNALSLFYMMISIIIPTVGLTIVTAVLTFIGVPISLTALLTIWFFIAFIQFMFVQYSLNKRPNVEGY